MSEPLPNNPYARPINATKPEGQMLQSEFYGQRAGDKALSHETRGRQVSSARRYASTAIAVPVDMDAAPAPKATRKRKATTPSPDVTSPSEPVIEATEATSTTEGGITEDDLFG